MICDMASGLEVVRAYLGSEEVAGISHGGLALVVAARLGVCEVGLATPVSAPGYVRNPTRPHPGPGRWRHPRQAEPAQKAAPRCSNSAGPGSCQGATSSRQARAGDAALRQLPQDAPGLDPVAIASARLKAHLTRAEAHSDDQRWPALGNTCSLFEPEVCSDHLEADRHVAD